MSSTKKPSLVILAAGMGSRYGGLKQVDSVGPGGEAIIDYSVYDALNAGFGKIIFVIRQDIEAAFKEKVSDKWQGKAEIHHVFQEPDLGLPEEMTEMPTREKPWGTAHAVLAAKDVIDEPFAVINADDYYGSIGYKKMADFLNQECSPSLFSMLGYVLKNTLSDFGSVSRGVCAMDENQFLTTVTERHKIRRENGQIVFTDEDGQDKPLKDQDLVSMNFWGFHPSILTTIAEDFKEYVRNNWQNPRGEFYIPFVVNKLIDENKIYLKVIANDDQWFGVTYQEDKPVVQDAMKKMADNGAYPTPVWQ
ncbi:MAG: sugar phosphate nucleotidyltransferase [Saprospiraceae bacterium]